MKLGTTSIAAVGLAGALALAGCSSSGSGTVSPPATSAGAAASSPATSTSASASAASAAAVGSTVDGAELGAQMRDAMVKAKTGKASMTMAGTGAGQIKADTVFEYVDENTTNSQANMTMSSLDIVAVMSGGAIYIKGLPTQLTGGKPWVKVDPNGDDPISKSLGESLSQGSGPDSVVKGLQNATVTVKDVSDGATTYHVTGLSAGTATAAAGSAMDLKVGADGLPISSEVTVSGVTVALTYSDWGAPVSITVPAAGDIGTLKTS